MSETNDETPPADPPPPPPSFPPPAAAPPMAAPPEPAGFVSGYAPVQVPPGTYYDPRSGLALPEGTVLAPIARRIGAFFLAIPLIIVTLVIGYFIWGIIAWTKGTTPALQVLGMRCYRPQEQRVPGFWWMALRNIVGHIVEGILGIFTAVASFIVMCVTKERRCLHDLIAGTIVLHDPDKVLDNR